MVDLGIVILNWNTSALLKRCLETVYASQGDFSYQVVVVDNASPDDSAAMVRRDFPQAQLIVSETNNGYSAGNNVGLRALGYKDKGRSPDAPRYALLLNPDTGVPTEGLRDMITFMDAQPKVGVAGPKLVLMDGSLDRACRRSFPTPLISLYHFSGLAKLFPNSPRFARYNMTYLPIDQEAEVDSVVGAYM
ncbi:MAG: glycosyltransferase, partial [Chloroflexota bacterium]